MVAKPGKMVAGRDGAFRRARSGRGRFRPERPEKIAASLERSARRSRRRKADPFRSAMSMLTYTLTGRERPRRQTARRARKGKDELRARFGRERKK